MILYNNNEGEEFMQLIDLTQEVFTEMPLYGDQMLIRVQKTIQELERLGHTVSLNHHF